MKNYILAGVGSTIAFNASNEIMFNSDTLTESNVTLEVSSTDIKGGLGNKLLGRYFHDSVMRMTLTDALFNLQYLSLNVGGNITIGGEELKLESITTTVQNQITITDEPTRVFGEGTIGWYTIDGEDKWTKIVFVGKVATVSGLPAGSNVCVKYHIENADGKTFNIPASIIPSIFRLHLYVPLFAAGETENVSGRTRVGTLVYCIPKFQLDGSQEYSLTADGVATTSMAGQALAYKNGTGCSDESDYGYVVEIIDGYDISKDLTAMAIVGADVQLAVAEKTTLKAIGTTKTESGVINNSKITFTSGTPSIATVNNVGEVTAVSAGKSQITATVTNKPSVVAYAEVTVSA